MNKGYEFPTLYVPSVLIDIDGFSLYIFYTSKATHAVLISKQDSSIFFEVSCSSGKGGLGWVPVGKAMPIHADILSMIKDYYLNAKNEYALFSLTDAKAFIIDLVARIDKCFVECLEHYDIAYEGNASIPNKASWIVL